MLAPQATAPVCHRVLTTSPTVSPASPFRFASVPCACARVCRQLLASQCRPSLSLAPFARRLRLPLQIAACVYRLPPSLSLASVSCARACACLLPLASVACAWRLPLASVACMHLSHACALRPCLLLSLVAARVCRLRPSRLCLCRVHLASRLRPQLASRGGLLPSLASVPLDSVAFPRLCLSSAYACRFRVCLAPALASVAWCLRLSTATVTFMALSLGSRLSPACRSPLARLAACLCRFLRSLPACCQRLASVVCVVRTSVYRFRLSLRACMRRSLASVARTCACACRLSPLACLCHPLLASVAGLWRGTRARRLRMSPAALALASLLAPVARHLHLSRVPLCLPPLPVALASVTFPRRVPLAAYLCRWLASIACVGRASACRVCRSPQSVAARLRLSP